ncbi:MAG: hypothetical protein WCO23_01575, partial [bacterium]
MSKYYCIALIAIVLLLATPVLAVKEADLIDTLEFDSSLLIGFRVGDRTENVTLAKARTDYERNKTNPDKIIAYADALSQTGVKSESRTLYIAASEIYTKADKKGPLSGKELLAWVRCKREIEGVESAHQFILKRQEGVTIDRTLVLAEIANIKLGRAFSAFMRIGPENEYSYTDALNAILEIKKEGFDRAKCLVELTECKRYLQLALEKKPLTSEEMGAIGGVEFFSNAMSVLLDAAGENEAAFDEAFPKLISGFAGIGELATPTWSAHIRELTKTDPEMQALIILAKMALPTNGGDVFEQDRSK